MIIFMEVKLRVDNEMYTNSYCIPAFWYFNLNPWSYKYSYKKLSRKIHRQTRLYLTAGNDINAFNRHFSMIIEYVTCDSPVLIIFTCIIVNYLLCAPYFVLPMCFFIL